MRFLNKWPICMGFVLCGSAGFCYGDIQDSAGYQSEEYKLIRGKLVELESNTSQFCLSGAALSLAGENQYVNQYRKNFAYCIDRLLVKYQDLKVVTNTRGQR